jgi:serine/threonine protein kinase
MMSYPLNGVNADGSGQVLWEDGERVFRGGRRLGDDDNRSAVLVVPAAAEHPSPSSLDRLTHEYDLKDELDGPWTVRWLDLVREGGRTVPVLGAAGGEPLDRLPGAPIELGRILRLAFGIAIALGKLHQRGLVHKDIKPANIILNDVTGEMRLTGFGIGTGALPFTAADPMEWVHCCLAKQPVAPADRVNEIPDVVSPIIMKLLAKPAKSNSCKRGLTIRGMFKPSDQTWE